MAKLKTKYTCENCGYETSKWWGVCPSCSTAGTLKEEVYTQKSKTIEKQIELITLGEDVSPIKLSEVKGQEYVRFSTGIKEFDRVLGGGIVNGSLVLIGGDPGIGKSTILLQLTNNISDKKNVLYVSAEESLEQIKLRADRIFEEEADLLIMAQTNLEIIEKQILDIKPDVVIIDSIQTISSTTLDSLPGSVSQVKDIANRLMKICKKENVCCFIVGHVTKDGAIAGPRVLEHLVDTVLYFEGEKYNSYRMIRAVKNRFGSTNELGVFEMTDKGLVEVDNPSKVLLSGSDSNEAGTAIVSCVEGTRPMLVEIQSLVISTNFPSPRRTGTGIDYNRLNMLLAVLEKHAGILIQNYDVYVNLTGGIKLNEPFIDLGVIIAVASSYYNIPVKGLLAICGEVGLTGEIRNVSFVQNRINEAEKLGFEEILIPYSNLKDIKLKNKNIKITGVKNIKQALDCSISNVKKVKKGGEE
ncbi:DNA repair protein RadA [Peptoanaerobacter stomatis]